MPVIRDVLSTPEDDDIVIRSDIGTSEDEEQKIRERSFRKKAMNASKKLKHTLRRCRKRATDRQRAGILIYDVRYVDKEKVVHSSPQALLSKHVASQDYFSTSICGVTRPEVAAARVEHFSSRSDFIDKSTLRKLLKNVISYVGSLLLHWILNILAYTHTLFRWLERSVMVIYADRKQKNQYLQPLAQPESQLNCNYPELDDLLWKKLLHLESLVMELCDKPAENPPEEEDMFVESMNRTICIEYDLQMTKKALRNTASKQVELNESLEYFMETSLTVPNSCWLTQCKSFPLTNE